ncbi:MAG TPA: hypothetical protein VFM05_15420 [Candidatus Saccharimonadales bacterium]|nr:hypothetical protein [Candidatus Saccharimonadales bacterium]
MSNRVSINKEVAVTAVYFQNSKELKSFPKRMEFDGREYTFLESGLRYLVQKGHRLIQIFDMTDGIADYRLRHDSYQNLWTLVDISETPRALA